MEIEEAMIVGGAGSPKSQARSMPPLNESGVGAANVVETPPSPKRAKSGDSAIDMAKDDSVRNRGNHNTGNGNGIPQFRMSTGNS